MEGGKRVHIIVAPIVSVWLAVDRFLQGWLATIHRFTEARISPQFKGLRHLYLKTENLQNVVKFLESIQLHRIFFSFFFLSFFLLFFFFLFFLLHLYQLLCLLQLSMQEKNSTFWIYTYYYIHHAKFYNNLIWANCLEYGHCCLNVLHFQFWQIEETHYFPVRSKCLFSLEITSLIFSFSCWMSLSLKQTEWKSLYEWTILHSG